MDVHSALGKRHGIAKEDIDNLIALNPKNFDDKEWLALKYVQDWTFLGGEEPSGEYMIDFKKQYNSKERAYILKLMRTMLFANYFNNLLRKGVWKSEIEGITSHDYCNLEPSSDKKID